MRRGVVHSRPRLSALVAIGAAALLGLSACGGSSSKSSSPRVVSAPSTSKSGKVRSDFVGLVSEDAYAATPVAQDKMLAKEAELGVGLLRQTFDWSRIETTVGRYSFAAYDGFVAAAARHGITILPILFNPPPFRSSAPPGTKPGGPTFPPKDAAAMGQFATAVIARYGPKGSLWAQDPRLPKRAIRSWQVWNEPNLPAYWGGTPKASEYAAMLRVVGSAITKADPGATVVTGGIPNSKLGIPFVDYVKALFAAGAKGTFDALAIHPYAKTEPGVVLAVEDARRLLDSLGAKKAELWVTEFGWASGGPGSQFTVTEATQAAYVKAAVTDLITRRDDLRLRGFVYFNWMDAPPYAGGKDFWGLHTGLNRIDGKPKPARNAFASAVRALK